MLVAHVAPLGEPPGVDPQRLRLVAPYTADLSAWESLRWRNLYDPNGPDYRITTTRWDNRKGPRPADGGSWRSAQQQVADLLDRLSEA